MKQFRALLLVNLKAMLSTSGSIQRRRQAMRFSALGTLLLMAGLSAYLSCTYSFLMAAQLAPGGQLPLLFLLMPVLALILGLLFTVFAAQGILFGGRDNDLMLSLPITPFQLMLTRTAALYLENLLITAFVLLPAGIAWLWYGGGGGIWFVLRLLLGIVLLALLPTLLSLLGGFVLAWFSSKVLRKSVVSLFLYGILLVLVFVLVFRLNDLMTSLILYTGSIQAGFSGWGLPFLLLQRWICGGSVLSLLELMGLTLLPFLAAVWLFAQQYRRIVTGLTARSARSDYKLERVTAASSWQALFIKEGRRFFGSPIYLFNAGLGLLMLPAAGVAALFFRITLLSYLTQLETAGMHIPIVPTLAGSLCFMLSTIAITSSSISLEGKELWILKEAPIAPATLFSAKAGFQILLTLPCMFVALLCLGIALSLPPLGLAVVFFIGTLFSALTALLGLLVNLLFPRLDAPNDTVVVKQSAASMIGTFSGMILAFLLVGLWFLLRTPLGDHGALLLCSGACILALLITVYLLRTVGVRQFNAL